MGHLAKSTSADKLLYTVRLKIMGRSTAGPEDLRRIIKLSPVASVTNSSLDRGKLVAPAAAASAASPLGRMSGHGWQIGCRLPCRGLLEQYSGREQ